MFRRSIAATAVTILSGAVLSGAMLAIGALPAAAAIRSMHTFAIPGVYGITAWGHYDHVGSKVRITVCVKDTARDVYGGAAAGLAFDGSRHQAVTAVAVSYRHSACQTMTSRYTSHLVVDAVSGWPNGKVRQPGRVKQIYLTRAEESRDVLVTDSAAIHRGALLRFDPLFTNGGNRLQCCVVVSRHSLPLRP